ncbi:d-2-hydroxyglutarate dehydrogenase [Syncephalis fuscata]|nr:d-2-hydroxyglutarate dehydrogenase [Syncephalis fuscata]
MNRLVLNARRHKTTRLSTLKWGTAISQHVTRPFSVYGSCTYSSISDEDITFFKGALPPNAVITNEDSLAGYNMDWMRKYRGQSSVVLLPKTTEQVSKVLAYCNERRLGVVPQGGNTGLVGGGVPVFDEVIISTQRLNKIRSFDAVSGTLSSDAGCVLEALDNYLAERGYMMPLDLGAKGSCHIGGNVATNAGGLRLLRYGSLHGTVLGLETVLPDGTVLDNMSTLRKDNTGYDLKQLFIGSEGTLGLITGVSILTPKRANSVNIALVGLDSFEKVQETFHTSRNMLSEVLSAFEFWDDKAATLVKNHGAAGNKNLFDKEYPFYVLVETQGSNNEHDTAKLNLFLEKLLEDGIVEDGVVAQDDRQVKLLWARRELIPEACSKAGAVYKYDVSIPVPKLYSLVEDMRDRLAAQGLMGNLVEEVIGYGHVGDGNLHLNITATSYDPQVTQAIDHMSTNGLVTKHAGSVSAEHGLGLMKAEDIGYSKSPNMISLMRKIKQLIDPHGIMNPYKYFPSTPS